jgi:cell wall-associated NlpC family hydrolase
VPAGSPLGDGRPGVLGASRSDITHVAIYFGQGDMIDAPHTGAVIRIESYRWSDYEGAARPAG